MIRQLEALPGATVTADVTSGPDAGQNNVGVHARLSAAAATVAQANDMADSIVRITWTRWASFTSASPVRAAAPRC
jgi:hypothetical protein